MAKKIRLINTKPYRVKAFEEECGAEMFDVYAPITLSKEAVMDVLKTAAKYANCFDGSFSLKEGIEEYDSFYPQALENNFEEICGLDCFKIYLEDFMGWWVMDVTYDFEFEW